MYEIETRGHFSAAHFLEDYDGLCGNLHGHRWEVVLKVKAPLNENTQMLIDFNDLKRALNELMDMFDHSFIVDPYGNEESRKLYETVKGLGMKVFSFAGRTTAENIAKFIWEWINDTCEIDTHSITVYEAPNNGVTYKK